MFDLSCSLALVAALTLALGAYALASLAAGHALTSERVEREAGLAIVGRAPMHAVYRVLGPAAHALVRMHVGANAVSLASLALALLAAVSFAFGHYGVGAAIAVVASLADAVDGQVARLTKTASPMGKVLDTTIDRYADVMLIGGIAIDRHASVPWLVVCLAAIAGSFMVSYASSVERELGVVPGPVPMRRAQRLAYLLTAAGLTPFGMQLGAGGLPVALAVSAIAVVGNVSAVRRLAHAARVAPPPPPRPSSDPRFVAHAEHEPAE